MSYAIIGFGSIGQALAKAFARSGIEVSVATTREPESFASDAAAIGPQIIPATLAQAAEADLVFLAVARAFTGARLVKGFNHLVAGVLEQDPAVNGGRRVVFLASDDDDAATEIGTLAENLGFAPIQLGGLSEGGLLVQARGNSWGRLIFKDLVKLD
jgi:predicted dinucleotide-binding enzyme